MKSGDLLLKVHDNKTAEKFLKANYIDCIPVRFSLHKTLNTVQGRIFSRKLIDISQEDLLTSLKEQKVIDVRKITKKENNNIVATGAAIITFDMIYRPDVLKLGWERVPVDEYIPNPMKCINCQRLGHTKKWCKNVEQCKECGITQVHEKCTRKYCVNCQVESHTSYDPKCPTYWKHKSVNYLRISRRCTTREAWKIFNENPSINMLQPPVYKNAKKNPTYAQITSSALTTIDNKTSQINIPDKIDHVKDKNNSTLAVKEQTQNSHPKTNNSATNLNENLNSSTKTQHSTNSNKTTNTNAETQIPDSYSQMISLNSTTNLNENFNSTKAHHSTTNLNKNFDTTKAQHSTTTNNNNTDRTAETQLTNQNSFTPLQNSYSQIMSLSTKSKIITTDNSISDDCFTRDGKSYSLDDSFDEDLNQNIDENLTEEMIIQDKSDGLGFNTPPRGEMECTGENTPVSLLYNNFPQLNVIITPNTLKNTKHLASKGKMEK
ncbi:hypothetical protein CVS40_4245 [Lucilia cuprina]|nr:hypothetical protein CVS40_4245 [Lucilia cuprina]